MSLRTTQSELALIDDLIVITQRVEKEWRCLFATIQENNRPTVIETVVVDGNGALEELLQSKKPASVYSILPGSSTVCRTTTLPDVDNDQILEALRLQAHQRSRRPRRSQTRHIVIEFEGEGQRRHRPGPASHRRRHRRHTGPHPERPVRPRRRSLSTPRLR